MSFRLPRTNEIMPLVKPKGNITDIKPALEVCFANDVFIERTEQFMVSSVEGHGILDLDRVITIAIEFDDKVGASIRASKLDRYKMIDQLRVVMRRHYIIGDGKNSHPMFKGKAIDINRHRYLLIENKAD